ncbi:MAG: hypothetical protein JWN70_6504 [Planctomycetaceae bacterium]|nr:hypothetical protein [Planctomycetaceae bacterium]
MQALFESFSSLLFLVMLTVGARMAGKRSSTLVLQKFYVSQKPPLDHAPNVEIVGRMQGMVAFVLSLLGFSPITRLTIARGEVRYESSSLFGQRSQFVPLRCLTGISAGVYKPVSALFIAAMMLSSSVPLSYSLGSFIPLAVGLLQFIGLTIFYVLTKKFFIDLHAPGAPTISLLLKPNVLEGVPIDVAEALAVVAVIRDLTLQSTASSQASSVFQPAPLISAPDSGTDSVASSEGSSYEEEVDESDEDAGEVEARDLVARARQYVQAGQREQAVSVLQAVVRRFPNTTSAEQARRSLEKIGIHG